MAETLSDAEVFGSPRASPPAPGTMSDVDVYGLTGYVEPGTNTTGVDPDVDPRVTDAVSSVVKRLVAPSPKTAMTTRRFATGDPRDSLPPAPVVAPIEKAMGEGWQATPSILTPEGEALVDRMGWLGSQFINPGLKILNLPGAAINSLMYGGAELANQVTGDPRAGRDALTLMQLWPMGRNGVIASPGDLPPTEPTPAPRPQFVSERAAPDVSGLDPRNAIQTLIQHDIEENPPILAPGQGAANQGTASPLAPPPGVEPVTRAAPLMDNFNQGEAPPGTANQGTVSPPAPPTEAPAPGEAPAPQSGGYGGIMGRDRSAVLDGENAGPGAHRFPDVGHARNRPRPRQRPSETPGTVEDQHCLCSWGEATRISTGVRSRCRRQSRCAEGHRPGLQNRGRQDRAGQSRHPERYLVCNKPATQIRSRP